MQIKTFPFSLKLALASAGIYNILWGAIAVARPDLFFSWIGMPQPNYPELWQCIGMIVGVYGAGYLIAARDPIRHWPIVLVGLIGKVLGPMGAADAIVKGRLPLSFAWLNVANDLIWWLPFTLILIHAARASAWEARATSPEIQAWAMRAKSQYGLSILEHSKLHPVLLVFLRHAGCPFCREALADLFAQKAAIEHEGAQVVLVHMGDLERPLGDSPQVADPQLALYRAFGLEKASYLRVVGPSLWWRGIKAAFIAGHGIGAHLKNIRQMPGVFLVFHGEILKSYRHLSPADRPDYAAFASEPLDSRRAS